MHTIETPRMAKFVQTWEDRIGDITNFYLDLLTASETDSSELEEISWGNAQYFVGFSVSETDLAPRATRLVYIHNVESNRGSIMADRNADLTQIQADIFRGFVLKHQRALTSLGFQETVGRVLQEADKIDL